MATELHQEATARLRGIAAKLVTLLPPDDVAGIFLVQAIATMGLTAEQKLVSAWLRELADEVDAVGTVNDQMLN